MSIAGLPNIEPFVHEIFIGLTLFFRNNIQVYRPKSRPYFITLDYQYYVGLCRAYMPLQGNVVNE